MTEENPEESPTFAVTVYPNPFANDGIYVRIENLSDHQLNYDIKIYDFNGNLKGQEPLIIEVSNTKIADFDTESISPGYYIVKIFDGSTQVYYSLIYK